MAPIIDRNLQPEKQRKIRNHSSNTLIFAVMLVVVLSLGAVAGLIVQIAHNGDSQSSETPSRNPAGALFLAHDPIRISGNGGFDNYSGVGWGSGTASDPYIIANWFITVFPGNGIWITDVDAHFIIRNCYVGGFGYADAIGLSNCHNGTLEGNFCTNNNIGIYLTSSSNNTLIDNLCFSNGNWGIHLYSSNDNTLSNNICSSNSFDGMYLYSSSNNTLDGNTCISNSGAGIWLDASNNNILVSNDFSLNDADGMTLALSSHGNGISHNLVGNNTGYGVSVESGSGNRIWNNTFIGNNGATGTYDPSHVQASDAGTYNSWNGTDGHGNWWNDWQSPDNVPPFGIVDLPYNISGSANAQDNYPLTTPPAPIPEFGMMPIVVMVLMAVIVLAGETRQKKKP